MNDTWWCFKYNWPWYAVVILAAIMVFGILMSLPVGSARPPATIATLAEGTVVSVRATGAWENWCKIELKFEDGVVLLTSYYFIQHWNIREGRQYLIQRNSRTGMTAKEL